MLLTSNPNFELGIHSNVLFPESSNDWHESEVHSDTNSTYNPLKHLIFSGGYLDQGAQTTELFDWIDSVYRRKL